MEKADKKNSFGMAGRRYRPASKLSKMGSGGVVMSGDVVEGEKETVRGAKRPRYSFSKYRG